MSKVLGKEVVLSMESITQVTRCIREWIIYQDDCENPYESHVPKALYGKNLKETDGTKKVQYNLLCDMAKVWSNISQKSFIHRVGLKDFVSDLQKFMLKIPFDIPHIIYINILRNMKTLGGVDDIHYATFINKLLWEYEVFHIFKRMDKDSK